MSERSEETSDPEEVKNWADRRGLVPARRTDTNELVLVDEGVTESGGATDRLGWDEFAAEFDRRDATFRYPEDDADVADREADDGESDDGTPTDPEALRRAETDEVLEEGESARTEVTETRTVETEVVRSATVETEVVDEEETSEEVVDTEVLDRELTNCTIDESGEYIEADLRERKLFTTEVRKQDVIESRVVDADADAEGADAETVDREVDTEGESALVDETAVERELDGTEVPEHAETEVEADAIDDGAELHERTERQIVETEVVSRYRVRADVTSRDRIDAEVVSEEITETNLLDGTERETSDGTDEDESEESVDDDPLNETVWVDDSHEGDAVVDADGETVGRIARVDGLTIHVAVDGGGEASIRQDQVEEVREGAVTVSGLGED